MGSWSPRKLDANAIEWCASIAGVERRDIFDPNLAKLVTAACRWDEQHRKNIADRTKIVKAGRVLAKALREASPQARRRFDLGLPYGAAWLDVTLDAMAPASPRARHTRWNAKFVILLCVLVEEAGGKLTLDERRGKGTLVDLLEVLEPHLPKRFVPAASFHTLRRLKESAGTLGNS